MTLPYSASRIRYEGNGVTTLFPFPFKVWNEGQLVVSVTSPQGVTASVHDWNAELNDDGGTIAYAPDGVPLPQGWTLSITRGMPFDQQVDLVSATRFDPQVMEDALDQATAERQELREQISRAVILPATSEKTPEQVVRSIYQSRDAAAASAQAAADAATEAGGSAALATDSAGDAATSESNASGSAALAHAWAEGGTPPDPTDPASKSAKAWALVAEEKTRFPRSVGELVHSLVPLDDASLHLLDGTLLAADGMYAAGIAKIAALQTDHPGLFATEADWQASVAVYGACGKFVYDATAGTLRLPKVTGFMEATIDASALGDLVEAGLPNITGTITGRKFSTGAAFVGGDGKLFVASSSGSPVSAVGTSGTADVTSLGLDASRSNPIYGNSATVQPQSIKGFVYMVLANTVKAPVVVDAEQYANDVNALAGDVATRTTAAGAAHAAMPSGKMIDISVNNDTSSSSSYTMKITDPAPSDGYITVTVSISSPANGDYMILRVADNHQSSWTYTYYAQTWMFAASQYSTRGCAIPVSKGQRISLQYKSSQVSSAIAARFIYANGTAPA